MEGAQKTEDSNLKDEKADVDFGEAFTSKNEKDLKKKEKADSDSEHAAVQDSLDAELESDERNRSDETERNDANDVLKPPDMPLLENRESDPDGHSEQNEMIDADERSSTATSMSELIDVGLPTSDDMLHDTINDTDGNNETTFLEHSEAASKILETASNHDLTITAQDDILASKENDPLTERIAELNDELTQAKSHLEEIRKAFQSYEDIDEHFDSPKGPKLLFTKLKQHETENVNLKQKVNEQNDKLRAAEAREEELRADIKKLAEHELEITKSLKIKENEVEELQNKVDELRPLLESRPTMSREASNDNGMIKPISHIQLSTGSRASPSVRSNTPLRPEMKRSKICILF
ncbi:unnamed protein product [Clavelina lepadiformis]|uniref:Uncharacterized protein n=1 Tax=Clavelina lepadiformis TaxID=159417 RepID=A0ABP0GH92_CLALP